MFIDHLIQKFCNSWTLYGLHAPAVSKYLSHVTNFNIHSLSHTTRFCQTFSYMWFKKCFWDPPSFSSTFKLHLRFWMDKDNMHNSYDNRGQRLYMLMFDYLWSPDSIYSLRTSRPDAFFGYTLFHPQLSLTPIQPAHPPPKAANTGNSSYCLYMRLCKPYSKTAGFQNFPPRRLCAFRPVQKHVFSACVWLLCFLSWLLVVDTFKTKHQLKL